MEAYEVDNQPIPASFHCVTHQAGISQPVAPHSSAKVVSSQMGQYCKIEYSSSKLKVD